MDDLRESLKQGGVWLARLAGQGDPNLRKHGKVRLDWCILGVGNNQSSRVQATRLYTTSYQTVRIQDWKDYIDLQGAILITLPSTAWWPQGAGGFLGKGQFVRFPYELQLTRRRCTIGDRGPCCNFNNTPATLYPNTPPHPTPQ